MTKHNQFPTSCEIYSTFAANLREIEHHARISKIFRAYFPWRLRGNNVVHARDYLQVTRTFSREFWYSASLTCLHKRSFVRLHARHQSRMLSKHSNALYNTSVHFARWLLKSIYSRLYTCIISQVDYFVSTVILRNVHYSHPTKYNLLYFFLLICKCWLYNLDSLGFSQKGATFWADVKLKSRKRSYKKGQSMQAFLPTSCKCMNILKDKLVCFLTLYHTIPVFYDPKIEDLKMLWEEEKMLVTSISSFSLNLIYAARNKF